MVTQEPIERKDVSDYRLERVQEMALSGSIIYSSERVEKDVDNLGYSFSDVQKCLLGLKEAHYHESVKYDDKTGWFDVYKITWPAPDPTFQDELYIKLKLNRDTTLVVLASFHREGSL